MGSCVVPVMLNSFSAHCRYDQGLACGCRLLALNKEEDRQKFSMLLKKAVLVLTPSQKKNLPSPLKEKVQRRIELMEEKKAM